MDAMFHNLAIYVEPHDFDDMRSFYSERLGLRIVFEEPGHICCFDVGPGLAICVHEAEPGHAAGTRELFLWVDDEAIDPLAEERLNDPVGNQIRLHRRR